jgi:hypothetical protein
MVWSGSDTDTYADANFVPLNFEPLFKARHDPFGETLHALRITVIQADDGELVAA